MEEYFQPFIHFVIEYSYAAEFILLLACGLGLPVPEEVTLISAGYICWAHGNSLALTILVCMTSILLGDWIMFLLGRRYGRRLLRSSWFRRMLTPKKTAKVRLYFSRYGQKTVFFARFFAGIRVPVYFMAGTMRMSPWRFVWLDFLGALLSVPVSIWAGSYFGSEIRRAIEVTTRLKTQVAIAILLGVALYVAYRYLKLRRTRAASAGGLSVE